MHALRHPKSIFLMLVAVYLLYSTLQTLQMPDMIATHFDFDGLSLQGKESYAAFMQTHSWWFGCILICCFFAMDWVLYSTNHVAAQGGTEPELGTMWGILVVVFLLTSLLWWILSLIFAVQKLRQQGL